MKIISIGILLVATLFAAPTTDAQATVMASLPRSSLRDPFHSPRREAAVREKARVKAPPPASPSLTATSLIVAGDRSIATLRGANRFLVVGVGDWVDGWRVVGVTQDGVALRYGAGDSGAVARISLQRFTRSKGGRSSGVNGSNSQGESYAAGNGGALPGGDIPLLPESSGTLSGAPSRYHAQTAQDAGAPPPVQPTVPRLAPHS